MSIILSREEVALHNRIDDCWVIAHNKVYNLTEFINRHPGGKFVIKSKAGQDVSKHFDMHTKESHRIWENHVIGKISKLAQCCCL